MSHERPFRHRFVPIPGRHGPGVAATRRGGGFPRAGQL